MKHHVKVLQTQNVTDLEAQVQQALDELEQLPGFMLKTVRQFQSTMGDGFVFYVTSIFYVTEG